MASFSKAMIIGNLGRDPEMRYTPNGRPVTEFSVAVNQSTKNQQTGEWVEATDWFRVTVWGDRAERTAENLRKGNRVFVEGRFRTREFEGPRRPEADLARDHRGQRRQPRARGRGTRRARSAPRPAASAAAPAVKAAAAVAAAGRGPTRPAGGDDDLDDLPF